MFNHDGYHNVENVVGTEISLNLFSSAFPGGCHSSEASYRWDNNNIVKDDTRAARKRKTEMEIGRRRENENTDPRWGGKKKRNRPTGKSPAVSAAVPSQPSVHPQCRCASSRAFILNRNPEIVFLIFTSMYLDLLGICIITSCRRHTIS